MEKMINNTGMKKFLLAIFILFFATSAFAAETRNINQLLREYGQSGISVPEKEKNREQIRKAEAELVEIKIKSCENMAYEFNRLEGKNGKHPGVYWDYDKGECIAPSSGFTPNIVDVWIMNPRY